MNVQIMMIITLAVLAAIFLFSRFLGGDYGQLRLNKEVGDIFNRFEVRDQMNYFISGPDACPNAIVGISQMWHLQTGLWKKKDLTPVTLKNLISDMELQNGPHHGFDILDHRGKKIGDWFSVLDVHPTIKIMAEHKLTISTPPVNMSRFSA